MNLKLDPIDFVSPNFYSFWVAENKYNYIIGKGGRNSAKSSHAALKMVWNRMVSDTSGLCMKKIGNTIRDSCYADVKWAVNLMGVEQFWDFKISPIKAVFLPKGTEILFRGGDHTEKIKGLKNKFPITDCWIDEAAEFKTYEELETLFNSVIRQELPNGQKYTFYITYNPPKRRSNFLNKNYNTVNLPSDTFVHHSTLFQNKYASSQMVQKAIETKKENINKYKWMYLGEAIGGGVVPFENLTFRTITDREIETFDNIRQGIDWGYASDAFSFVRWHYDKTRKKIYLLDEYHKVKSSDEMFVKWLKNKKYTERIFADNAEPKSIDRTKDCGVDIVPARKGPGSVETGEKWLDELTEIIIDYNRTPKSAKEFEDIDYAVDSHGEQLPRLVDKDNHSIDSTRYAFENDVRDSAGIW